MKNVRKVIALQVGLFLTWTSLQAMAPQFNPNIITRIEFVQNILGMPEELFRKFYDWNEKKAILEAYLPKTNEMINSTTNKLNTIPEWVMQFPRRVAIFQGQLNVETINEINNKIGNTTNPKPLLAKSSFNIILHDPENPQKTDILAMQADVRNYKDAAFQLASTFWGPLEGGIIDPTKKLTDMFPHNAQGEDATTGTAGAAIWRKYFMPTIRQAQGLSPYYYLLEKVIPDEPSQRGGRQIVFKDVLNYTFKNKDLSNVQLAIHKDIVISAGYGGHNPNDNQITYDIPIKGYGKLYVDKALLTSHIFTSAYPMFDALKSKQNNNPNVIAFAKMILNACYEGTIKTAYVTNKPHLVLTLMGAGAFRNNILWIAEAMERPEFIEFAKNAGMQIDIIYRPDKFREDDVKKGWPIRNAKEDIEFLSRIIRIADYINNTQFETNAQLKQLITLYVENSYALSKNNQDQKASKTASSLARELQAIFAGKQVGPIMAPQQAPSSLLSFTPISTLSNGEVVGWLETKKYPGDAILVNIGKNKQPRSIEEVTPINPDVPGYKNCAPEGLYFWRSQNNNPEIGSRAKKTSLKSGPEFREWQWNSSANNYVDVNNPKIKYDASRAKDISTLF